MAKDKIAAKGQKEKENERTCIQSAPSTSPPVTSPRQQAITAEHMPRVKIGRV